MKKIQKILVPTDFSETAGHAYRYALLMAQELQASIQLLHVVIPQIDSFDVPIVATQSTRAQIAAAEEAIDAFQHAGIQSLREELTSIPLVQNSVEIGSPIAIINAMAGKDEFPLIIMGTRNKHSTMDKFFGTVSSGVVAHAPCPVVVVPELANLKEITQVAYATDLQLADPYEIWRATRLLAPFHSIMHVVHFGKEDEKKDEPRLEDLEAFFQENKSTAIQIRFHHFADKDLMEGINAFVEQYQIDLLVMYRSHRGFPGNLFHRSKTKQMATTTELPLLVL